MERKSIISWTLFLVLGISLGYLFWGSSLSPLATDMMSKGSMSGQNIDKHFITQMIPHHEGAIAMAKIALERSGHQEIISLSKGIIEAQESEIKDMKSWFQSW